MPRARPSALVVLALAALGASAQDLPGSGPPGFADLGVGAGGPAPAPEKIAAQAGLERVLEPMLRHQLRLRARDRWRLRDLLGPPAPSTRGNSLVVAFEGTGAFEPHVAYAMSGAHRVLAPRLTPGAAGRVYEAATRVYARLSGEGPRWSGLCAGPLETLYEHPSLLGGAFDWYSFPSEESEAFASGDLETPTNIAAALLDELSGVREAMSRPRIEVRHHVLRYLAAAARLGPARPRVIFLTHSSGARAAVKVLDDLRRAEDPFTRQRGVRVDLVFSIDPVLEAQRAFKEVLPKLLRPRRAGRRVPVVASRPRPEDLRKPAHVARWVSVFQTSDTRGMDRPPRFGIHGSPVVGADLEEEIQGLGEAGHGAICLAPRTLELWRQELEELTPAKPQ